MSPIFEGWRLVTSANHSTWRDLERWAQTMCKRHEMLYKGVGKHTTHTSANEQFQLAEARCSCGWIMFNR